MKNVFIFILILVLASCKNSDNDFISGVVVDVSMDLSFVDANGVDLLNQNNPNSFKINDIKLYHQVNGEKQLFFYSNLDFPTGIMFHCERPPLCLIGISLSDTTFLELNDHITDTIYSEIISVPNNTSVTKIWYNGELIWDLENGTEHYFTMVK